MAIVKVGCNLRGDIQEFICQDADTANLKTDSVSKNAGNGSWVYIDDIRDVAMYNGTQWKSMKDGTVYGE